MNSPCPVLVLMSTHNGERFVVEQLRSILDQLPRGGRIVVRDDGSSDGTVAAIEGLAEPRIELHCGMNLGFGASFLTLLRHAPNHADMVMFSDQDDVWLPGKIDRASRALRPHVLAPALYGSAQLLADEQLRPLQATRPWLHSPSFQGALAENMVTGCTAAMNNAALRLLQRAGVPRNVHFHDWWLYLVVSAFGRVIFDPEPTLLYRQHGANQIGQGHGWFGRHLHMARFVLKRDWVGILLGQVHALWHHYGTDLDGHSKRLVTRHFSVEIGRASPRWSLVFGPIRWRESTELAFRLLLLLYKLRLWPPAARRMRFEPFGSS